MRNNPKLGEFEDYLREVFQQLVHFKDLPKYQLERRVDGFISVFLPDILRATCDWDTEIVAAEFPIKRESDNQSTNVDYLLYRSENRSADDAWLFVELKTDKGSFDEVQYSTYKRARISGMANLAEDLNQIYSKTRHKKKYKALFKKLKSADLNRPIELVYLIPSGSKIHEPEKGLKVLTFKQISKTELQRYPLVWHAFRDEIVKSIDP
jgi:hypothetical protein